MTAYTLWKAVVSFMTTSRIINSTHSLIYLHPPNYACAFIWLLADNLICLWSPLLNIVFKYDLWTKWLWSENKNVWGKGSWTTLVTFWYFRLMERNKYRQKYTNETRNVFVWPFTKNMSTPGAASFISKCVCAALYWPTSISLVFSSNDSNNFPSQHHSECDRW